MDHFIAQDRAVFGLAAFLYSAVFTCGLVALIRKTPYPRLALLGLLGFAFGVHTLALNLRGIQIQSCPLGNPFEVAHFIGWSLVLLFFIVGPAFKLKLLGFFTSGLAAVLSITPFLFPSWDAPHGGGLFGGNPWIELHAALAVFSYGIFAILSLISVMFLIQQYGLKHKRIGGIYAILPSLKQLDVMSRRMLWTGLIFLSGALGVGFVFWLVQPELVPIFKLIATLALWIGYLTLGIRRAQKQLISRRHAIATVGLFVFAMLTLWPVESARTSKEKPAAASTLNSARPTLPTWLSAQQ